MDTCNTAMFWLFSDQTLLTYFENKKDREKHNNFYSLLRHEKININEYEEHQKRSLDYLLNEGVIGIDDAGYLFFKDSQEVQILFDL